MEPDLQSLKRNDPGAWESFFARHDLLLRSIVSWSKWRFPPHVAEEVAQDIRVALPRSLENFKGDASLEHFIKRIGINICVSRIRRMIRERSRFVSADSLDSEGHLHTWDAPAGPEFDPVEKIVEVERADETRKLVDRLEETCRNAIRMFYLEELSYEQMSARLGISINTVGSRLAKCREKLRSLIREPAQAGEDDALRQRP